MSGLLRPSGRWAVSLWLLALATHSAAEGLQNLPADGWVAWDVPTVYGAPGWCCFENSPTAQRSGSQAAVCNLDDKQFGFGTRQGEFTDSLRIHVRLASGKVERVRSLATRCVTTTSSPEKLLSDVPVAASVAWLGRLIAQSPVTTGKHRRGMEADAMAALAVHRGNEARALLANLASGSAGANSGTTPPIETRKEAMFWLTQVRGQEGFDIVAPYLHSDSDAEIREHAAFCISQTRIAGAVDALIRQGENDGAAGVRSKAWFWLAQIKSPPSGGAEKIEKAIAQAVKQDRDSKVRHEAIFSLSQLPNGRAVPALRTIAEDRLLASAERKQAVFWITHNGGADALAYIDHVLAKTAPSQ